MTGSFAARRKSNIKSGCPRLLLEACALPSGLFSCFRFFHPTPLAILTLSCFIHITRRLSHEERYIRQLAHHVPSLRSTREDCAFTLPASDIPHHPILPAPQLPGSRRHHVLLHLAPDTRRLGDTVDIHMGEKRWQSTSCTKHGLTGRMYSSLPRACSALRRSRSRFYYTAAWV